MGAEQSASNDGVIEVQMTEEEMDVYEEMNDQERKVMTALEATTKAVQGAIDRALSNSDLLDECLDSVSELEDGAKALEQTTAATASKYKKRYYALAIGTGTAIGVGGLYFLL